MTQKSIFKNQKGFTLIETILALALGALVVSSLGIVLAIGLRYTREANERSELLQHARIAMARLSSELKYATELTQADSAAIEFDTKVLLDTDDTTTERVRYEIAGHVLQRFTDMGGAQDIAGNISGDIRASLTSVEPMKLDGSDALVPLDIVDPLSAAIALRFVLTMTAEDGDKVEVLTLIKLRNK